MAHPRSASPPPRAAAKDLLEVAVDPWRIATVRLRAEAAVAALQASRIDAVGMGG